MLAEEMLDPWFDAMSDLASLAIFVISMNDASCAWRRADGFDDVVGNDVDVVGPVGVVVDVPWGIVVFCVDVPDDEGCEAVFVDVGAEEMEEGFDARVREDGFLGMAFDAADRVDAASSDGGVGLFGFIDAISEDEGPCGVGLFGILDAKGATAVKLVFG